MDSYKRFFYAARASVRGRPYGEYVFAELGYSMSLHYQQYIRKPYCGMLYSVHCFTILNCAIIFYTMFIHV